MPYGQNATIGIAFQNSFGTPAAVGSLHHMPLLNEDISFTQEELISQNLNGRFDEGDAYSGPRGAPGQIEAEAQPRALGALLKAVVNEPITTTVASFVRQHVYNPRTTDWDRNGPNRPVSYYKHLADSNSAQMFYDLFGARMELQQVAGGFLIVRVGLVGGKRTTVASTGIPIDSTRRWPWNTASLSLSGVRNTDFTDLTITHDEGVEARHTLDGQLFPNRVKRATPRTIRVGGTVIFENQEELDKFVNEVEQPFSVTFRGTTEIQSGYFDTFTIEMPRFKYLAYPTNVGGPGELEVAFQGKADYHPGSGQSVRYILTNTHTAY
jgi:hypothetical protein